ncbi:MAG: PSD1 and planctomycete cytochrome C domain-containing protein [Planctomycetota bacterium]|nr:PSD1 and planctomycete cytochrome C domain-containing protein [Planctomycetota bacterium]
MFWLGLLSLVPLDSVINSRVAVAETQDPELQFERHVRPLLLKHCSACHGAEMQEGELRVDSREALLRGGSRGPAIEPGDSAASLLMGVVRHTITDLAMPPESEPLTASAIAELAEWIDRGAAWPAALPLGETPPSANIAHIRQTHWAFAPVAGNEESTLKDHSAAVELVDRRIAVKLAAANLTPSGPASREQLIRRATFDLTGLPPSPAEIDAFLADDTQDAYPRLIERLLASPAYGERWGRHWLDLVRYADTAGDASDYPVPEAFQYRNYVIDCFNQDLPYDQFVREQLAGDLLESENDDERWQKIIATGYLAIARRIGVSPHAKKHVMLEDVIDNMGKTFLGLSLGCARCHDHKFDPVPTSDYYALYGIFDSSIFPHAGAEHKQRRENFVHRLPPDELEALLRPHREKLEPVLAEINKRRDRRKVIRERPEHKEEFKRLNREIMKLWGKYTEIARSFPDVAMAYAISEGSPHDAQVQRQGDPGIKRETVRRGFLQVLGGQTLPQDHPQSGRLELASWVSDPTNPLTARVMVNRIWHHHFGRGLVSSTSDFGLRGNLPTHPELLDDLARYFVTHNWSVKAMHRLVMQTDAYQRSSESLAANELSDPDNHLLHRSNRRRLSAEEFRDAVLVIGGQLDREPAGPHPFPHKRTFHYRQHEPFQETYTTNKRSVYLLQSRLRKIPFIDLFDGPDGNLPFPERRATTTPLQSLYLMNAPFMHEQSQMVAERIMRETETEQAGIDWAYRMLFGRHADVEELKAGAQFFQQAVDSIAVSGQTESQADPKREAWAACVRSMFASNSFLYID